VGDDLPEPYPVRPHDAVCGAARAGNLGPDPTEGAPMPELRPAVLFDVDGTLLDTNYLHVLAWWQAIVDTRPSIGLTCGGIGAAELREAGADAVHADPAELLERFDASPLARIAAT